MFEAIRSLLADLSGRDRADDTVPMDERVATAALLVHAIAVDGDVSPKERDALRAALVHTYGLNRAEADDLIERASARDQEAVDLYGFTSVLKRRLDQGGGSG